MQPQKNEFFCTKLVDHLTRQNAECQAVIFHPKYAEIFEKYNLKQSGNAIHDLMDGKNADNIEDEDVGSGKNSRDTDDIGSPFSALSGDMGDELITIGPLGLADRFTKSVMYDDRGDRAYKTVHKALKSQPFKTGSARV